MHDAVCLAIRNCEMWSANAANWHKHMQNKKRHDKVTTPVGPLGVAQEQLINGKNINRIRYRKNTTRCRNSLGFQHKNGYGYQC